MTTSPKTPAAVSPTTEVAETATKTPTPAAKPTKLQEEMAAARAEKKAAPQSITTEDDDDIVVRTAPKAVSVRVGMTPAQVAARAKVAADLKAKAEAMAAENAAKAEAREKEELRFKKFLSLMTLLQEKGPVVLADPARSEYTKCSVDPSTEVTEEDLFLVVHGEMFPVCMEAVEAGRVVFNRLPSEEREKPRNKRLLLAHSKAKAKEMQKKDQEQAEARERRIQEEFESKVLEKFNAGLAGNPGINGEEPIVAPASRVIDFNDAGQKKTYRQLLEGTYKQPQDDGSEIPVPAPVDKMNPGEPITHVVVTGAILTPEDEQLRLIFCSQKTAKALQSLMAQKRVEIKGGIHHLFTDKTREEISLYGLSMGRKYFVTLRGK